MKYIKSFRVDGGHVDENFAKRLILNADQFIHVLNDEEMGIAFEESDVTYATKFTLSGIKKALGLASATGEDRVLEALYNLHEFNEFKTDDGDADYVKLASTISGESIARRKPPAAIFA